MRYPKQAIWRLVQLCAQELTKNGIMPFTRGDLIQCVQRKNPVYEADSINPIIQGITDNLRGGAPGAVGKDILHSVGRGLFVLKGRGAGHKESPVAVNRGRDSESRAWEEHQFIRPARPTVCANNDATVRIGEYDFRYICAIEPEREGDGSLREYRPQVRYKKAAGLALNRYGNGPFCKFKIPVNVELAGVYALIVKNKVRYIGECTTLSSRFNMGYGNISPRNCFVGGQETNCRINNLVLQQIKAGSNVSLWFLATDEYKAVERKLRESLPLSWNRV